VKHCTNGQFDEQNLGGKVESTKAGGDNLKVIWIKFSHSKFGCFILNIIATLREARLHLQLKIQPRFCPTAYTCPWKDKINNFKHSFTILQRRKSLKNCAKFILNESNKKGIFEWMKERCLY
jgi:hypothetical protein